MLELDPSSARRDVLVVAGRVAEVALLPAALAPLVEYVSVVDNVRAGGRRPVDVAVLELCLLYTSPSPRDS